MVSGAQQEQRGSRDPEGQRAQLAIRVALAAQGTLAK